MHHLIATKVYPRLGWDNGAAEAFQARATFDAIAAREPALEAFTQTYRTARRPRYDDRLHNTFRDDSAIFRLAASNFDTGGQRWAAADAFTRSYRTAQRRKYDDRLHNTFRDDSALFRLEAAAGDAVAQQWTAADFFTRSYRTLQRRKYDTRWADSFNVDWIAATLAAVFSPELFTGVQAFSDGYTTKRKRSVRPNISPFDEAWMASAVAAFGTVAQFYEAVAAFESYRAARRRNFQAIPTVFDDAAWIFATLPAPPPALTGAHHDWSMILRRLSLLGLRRWT